LAAAPLKPIPPKPAPLTSSLGAIASGGGVQVGPQKKIADSPMKPAVRPSPIQPPSTPAAFGLRTIAPAAATGLAESVPIVLCWGLLSVSGLLLLIQLWSYFS